MRGRTVMWTCSTCAFPAMTWACRISLCRRTWKRSSAGLLTLSRRRACTGSSGIRSSPTRRSCMRRDELYVADLVDNTRAIREYLDGISREQWDQDRVRRDAVVYRLLLLGETASALPDILRDRYPLRLRVGAGQESFHRVVQPVLRESPVFRYRGRGLPDHVRRDEHGIEVPGRPHGVIRDRQGSASNEEQLGS